MSPSSIPIAVKCPKCNVSALPPCPICSEYNPPPSPKGKPGTELKKIIPAIFEKEGCGCKEYATRMDQWGVVGCRQRRDRIIRRLLIKAHRRNLNIPWLSKTLLTGWVDRAIAKAGETLLPPEKDRDWFVGVTTAPRKEPTIHSCVEALRYSGWEPKVFAEPGSEAYGYDTVWNSQKLGIWHNWLNCCRYGLSTEAKYILTVQDDMDFHPDSKRFLTQEILDTYSDGFLSLYTPKGYSIIRGHLKPVGIKRVRTKALWGACALLWPREVLEEVLDSPIINSWIGAPIRTRSARQRILARRRDDPSLIANSDYAIGKIMNKIGRPMYFVDPSPTRHIAKYSSISHGTNKGKRNCFRCADHSLPLKKQVFPDGRNNNTTDSESDTSRVQSSTLQMG